MHWLRITPIASGQKSPSENRWWPFKLVGDLLRTTSKPVGHCYCEDESKNAAQWEDGQRKSWATGLWIMPVSCDWWEQGWVETCQVTSLTGTSKPNINNLQLKAFQKPCHASMECDCQWIGHHWIKGSLWREGSEDKRGTSTLQLPLHLILKTIYKGGIFILI